MNFPLGGLIIYYHELFLDLDISLFWFDSMQANGTFAIGPLYILDKTLSNSGVFLFFIMYFCHMNPLYNSEVFEIHSGPMGALTTCRSPTLVTFGQVIILTCICNQNLTLYNYNFTQGRNLQYNSKILIYPHILFITS